MGKRVDRTGEEKINNFGSKMKIIEYRNYDDIDVYFEEYNWVIKNNSYNNFKKGNIKCPYEPRIYNIACIGEGEYKISKNRKPTQIYAIWHHMIRRCYANSSLKDRPTYNDVEVCDEWLNFQNFAKWFENNYYEIEGEIMCLDKDILVKGNKIYSPDTCVFVPQSINSLFVKANKNRGNLPIGVTYFKRDCVYIAQCRLENNKTKNLGRFNSPEKAFYEYKKYKEKYIKDVAKEYKNKIPNKLYEAMMNYEVEITD